MKPRSTAGANTDYARRVCIQYGDSVTPSNARELINEPDADGTWCSPHSLRKGKQRRFAGER